MSKEVKPITVNKMKREIKFRAWNKSQKRFADSEFIFINGIGKIDTPTVSDHLEIMQYTGLLDKNSVEIYEGDIIECENTWDNTKWKTKVRFSEGAFLIDCEGQDWNITAIGFLDEETEIEVIGNIYENPELLK